MKKKIKKDLKTRSIYKKKKEIKKLKKEKKN